MNLKQTTKRVIKEETEGIDSFIEKLKSKYEISDELKNLIVDFINNSNCKKIEFAGFKVAALGLALHSGVLINTGILNQELEYVLFIILHEIAHQYQFKKYGEDVMYSCYLGEISSKEAAKFMQKTEIVADEFATRKIRELQKKGLIKNNFVSPQIYKKTPFSAIEWTTNMLRQEIKKNKIQSPEKVSEYFYNMVKSEL